MKKFLFYFDEIIKAETEEKRAALFNEADREYQRGTISIENLMRLLDLVNKLNKITK